MVLVEDLQVLGGYEGPKGTVGPFGGVKEKDDTKCRPYVVAAQSGKGRGARSAPSTAASGKGRL